MHCSSKVNSVSLMGVSNSENMLLSEKDLNAVEFDFLVNKKPKTTLELSHKCQDINSRTDSTVATTSDQDKKDKFEVLVSTLQVEIPTVDETWDRENSRCGDGFETPTSSDHKIPAALKCPPAPRKPRPLPPAVMKRKTSNSCRRVLLDVSAEIESLFPPEILADLIGGKIKRFRRGNDAVL